MSDDLRTDDDIADLFAEANPVPNPSATQAVDHGPASPARSNITIELDAPPTQHDDQQGGWRWWVLGAAAALVALVFGSVVVIVGDDATPADERETPTTITTPDTIVRLAEPLTSGPLFRLLDAFNARDADRMTAALSPSATAATIENVRSITRDLPWFDAFGWRIEDMVCRQPESDSLTCEGTTRNRLTEYTGVDIPTSLTARTDADDIAELILSEDFSEYREAAFEPFQEHVAANHPDDFFSMWNELPWTLPNRVTERAALFDAYLTEYTAGPTPPTPINRAFLEAHTAPTDERPDIATMFAPDGTISGGWADEPVAYAEALDVVAALGFDWGDPTYCRVLLDTDPLRITCGLRPTTKLDAAGLRIGGQTVSFAMSTDGIGAFAANDLVGALDEALAPFFDWIADEHPADAAALLVDDDGRRTLALDPIGADRLGELVDEYVSTVADDTSD